jgi:5-methylcytosine-specific restriction endonuclease McrA
MGKLNFISQDPTLAEYWRSVILFGNNVASYKFALAKSLLDIAPTQKTIITLDELAKPYARHICDHLKLEDKQLTSSPTSKFLDACRQFNRGAIDENALIKDTVRYGFNNVIDAFHHVKRADVPKRFFSDERSNQSKGIIITDELFKLLEGGESANLKREVEARWRLVETAWGLNISRNLIIEINHDEDTQILYAEHNFRRVNVTSCRDGFNGYQKGKCFHCFGEIFLEPGHHELVHVDHFFPHALKSSGIAHPIDKVWNVNGVWNLVLACPSCNLDKSDRLPSKKLVERLHDRNEFLINSDHPLKETLEQQTGKKELKRHKFLIDTYEAARLPLGFSQWEPEPRGIPTFDMDDR